MMSDPIPCAGEKGTLITVSDRVMKIDRRFIL